MKRACFIVPKAYQLFNPAVRSTFGGAEVQVTELARELVRQGSVEVHFVVADYGQGACEKYDGIHVWKAIDFARPWYVRCHAFVAVLRRIKPDVIVQTTMTPFSGILALYARITGRRFVYMVMHDGEVDRSTVVPGGPTGRLLAWMAFRLAHCIVVQNTYQASRLRYQTSLISPAIDPASVTVSDRRGVLWVGRSEPWKQPDVFLGLARRFPGEQFTMVCPPSTAHPELSVQIERRASQMANVTFHGFVPFGEVQHLYAQARVFVNTSTQEGFPTTFLQAGAVGVPVLSLSVDPDGLLQSGHCGFSCGDDAAVLAEHLERLLHDEALHATYSVNIRKYMATHHDIARSAGELLNILRA